MSSTGIAVTAMCSTGIATGLVCLLLVRQWKSHFYRRMAGLLGTVAGVSLANGIGLLRETDLLFWRQVALTIELMQPALMVSVGMAFVKTSEGSDRSMARWPVWSIGAVGLVLGALTLGGQIFHWRTLDDGGTAVVLGALGRVPYGFVVIAMTVGIAYLEGVLRASREPLRHKLKFTIIGMGGLAAYQIYEASRMLLFPVWKPEQVMVSGIVTILALGLIAYGMGRSRLHELFVHTYISHQALVGSVSVIAIGGYLLAVGAVGTWLRETNRPLEEGLSVVLVFSALVFLIVVIFSKTVRAEVRRVLTRNFYRTKYDYRAQWLTVTEAFHLAADREGIMDALLDLLIRTFPTPNLSIWSFREADRRFVQSRALTTNGIARPVELSHPVITQLMKRHDGVWLEEMSATTSLGVDREGDPFLSLGTMLCFPIDTHGRLIAFIALGRQRHGEAYGSDDCDLLRVIAHHVGMLLSHANLAEERRVSVELDAIHRFSIFCLHDLKNLAARLSLVAQNAERYGEDPAFQASAMRTVRDTAAKMTGLISKLSLKSTKPVTAGTCEPINLSTLIHDIVTSLQGGRVRWQIDGGAVQPLLAVREEIHQIMLNITLNAKQAIDDQGDVRITLVESPEAITITVQDTGCGIPEGRLESLFRPAGSSRPGGLGIGLYQCKQLVEAHGGTIQIRSEVGRGTLVQVQFPLSVRTPGQPLDVIEPSVLSV
ncbi:MAG TPA: PEP-CTERM system histidine kinase PrsK [Nitrospira sp.]|nr:PEP-CTERM system histidine kinase PrsK [Nitrospira sp.]